MCAKTKKQYVHPGRLHYEVWQRDKNGANYDISFQCDTTSEGAAYQIAAAMAERYKYVTDRSFVVRAKPTEAHNIRKFSCNDEFVHHTMMDRYYHDRAAEETADRIVAASVNGSGKPSPTVVKAVQKALH